MNCLLDADALIALSKEDDSNHILAKKTIEYLDKIAAAQLISPLTVAEACTAVSRKTSHQAAKRLLEKTRKQNLPTVTLPDYSPADKWFAKQKDKKCVSYFDCYNLALLEEYKNIIHAIFSFDKIYPKNGFRLASQLLAEE